MSRIDGLIKELSPRGVQFKALGEVGTFTRGGGLQKSGLTNNGVPAIHYGQIHTHYGTSAAETISFVTPEFAAKLRKAHPGDLVIATTSEDDEAVGKAVAWIGNKDVAVSGDAYIYHHTLEPKYVSYFFQSEQFHDQKKRGITGTKVRRISGDNLAKIRLPVPPIEVQREIVRILDSYASLEAELEVELEAELEARQQQYAYYRDSLLAGPGGGGVSEAKASRGTNRPAGRTVCPIGEYRGGPLREQIGHMGHATGRYMTLHELSESIPPAYTEFVGRQLVEHVSAVQYG